MNSSDGLSELIKFMGDESNLIAFFQKKKDEQTKEYEYREKKILNMHNAFGSAKEVMNPRKYKKKSDELNYLVNSKEYGAKMLKRVIDELKISQNDASFSSYFDDFEKVIQKEQLIVDMMKLYLNKIKFMDEISNDQTFKICSYQHKAECSLFFPGFIHNLALEFKKHLSCEKKLKLDEMMLKYCFDPINLEPIHDFHSPQEQIGKWLNWKYCSVVFDSSIHLNDDVKLNELKSRNKEHLFFVLYDDCDNVFGAYLNPSLVDGGWIMDPHCFVCSFRRNGKNNYKTYSLDVNYKIEPSEMNWLYILGNILTKGWYKFEDVMDKLWYCNPSCINYKEETNSLVDDSFTNEHRITKITVLSNVEPIVQLKPQPSIDHLLSLVHPLFLGQVRINVKTITENMHTFGITLDEHVSQLKERIKWVEGIPLDQQRLIFAGKQMEDEKKLSDYNIKENDTVHLVLRLCGGCSGYCQQCARKARSKWLEEQQKKRSGN